MIGTSLPPESGGDGDHAAFLEGLFHRTGMLLGAEAMERLRSTTVAIGGCGGVGGATAITLCRLGVGGFVLADPGIFDPPDLNRQWAGTRVTLERNKTEVHAEILRAINPEVRLHTFTEGVTEENLDAFLEPADLYVDCLDISVPLSLRSEVYRRVMARGMYGVTSPIFGFGTLILFAEPGGMGMDELIEGFVEVASTESKLPPGFGDNFFPPFIDAIEREIHKHKIPTSSIAVCVSTGLISAEIVLILLRDLYPSLRAPICLPQVFVVDPLQPTYRVMHHDGLFVRHPTPPSEPAGRAEALAAVHHNVAALDHRRVGADFLSDSWADLPASSSPVFDLTAAPEPDLGALLQERYGYPHNAVVFRGRFAEAVLAPLLVKPGQVVLANALFPTTRFHLEAAGARVVEIPSGTDADLDLTELQRWLSSGDVGALYVEPCNNALAGQPLSIANLQAARDLCAARAVPVVLDGCRAYTNAALLSARAGTDIDLAAHVRELCALTDATATSLSKDWSCPVGAFLGVRDDALFEQLRDRVALMTGHGLRPGDRHVIGASLAASPHAVRERVQRVRRLTEALAAAGVPVVRPAGGHAVYVDARAALPHLSDALPAEALANAVFEEAGVRGARNMGTQGRHIVRYAVPVGTTDGDADAALVAGLTRVLERAGEVRGLRQVGGPGGVLSDYAGAFETV